MSTEAQKRASKKYRQNHLDYYSKKSTEYFKKCRLERKQYKEIIDKAIEYINNNKEKQYGYNYEYGLTDKNIDDLLNILQGEITKWTM